MFIIQHDISRGRTVYEVPYGVHCTLYTELKVKYNITVANIHTFYRACVI